MNTEPEYPPRPSEWLAVLALLSVTLLLNLLTINWYPNVWADDVLWSEPAINLVRTGHFTTSVWEFQPAGTFWAAQSPLYPLALSVWLRLAGFELLAVKSFNLILAAVAALLVWVATWKYRLIGKRPVRLALIPLLLMGYGMSFAYRSSRPDMAGMIALAGFWLAFSTAAGRRKEFWILATSFLTPWVGIQVALYAACAGFLAHVVLRVVTRREIILVAAGITAGSVLLFLFFALHGSLHYFLGSISQAANEHLVWGHAETYFGSIPRRLHQTWLSYVSDFSVLPLLLGTACFCAWLRSAFGSRALRSATGLLVLFVTIPMVFNFTGHFAFYYSYMIYVPMVVAFLVLYCEQASRAAVPAQVARGTWVFVLAALGASLAGLPLRLAVSASFCNLLPRREYASMLKAKLRAEDVVFCDYTAFFEAKQAVQAVYSPMYARHFCFLSPKAHEFSDDEKKRLTVMIIQPESAPDARDYFGGQWTAVSEPFGDSFSLGGVARIPFLGKRLEHHFSTPQMSRHKVQIFRRTDVPAVPTSLATGETGGNETRAHFPIRTRD
jgi:hypothetical protein